MPTADLHSISSHPQLEKESFLPEIIWVCGNWCLAAIRQQCLNITLENWPTPELVQDVTSFISFMQFYSALFTYFEVHAKPLHEIMKHEYTACVGNLWTPAAVATFEELCNCASFVILALVVSITRNSQSSELISFLRALVTSFASQTTMTPLCNLFLMYVWKWIWLYGIKG